MNVTVLGTGTSQGVPVIGCQCRVCQSDDPKDKRLRTSVMVEDQGKVVVIDTGPDFRQQMLREDVRRLDAVVYTHEHKDHVAGMDDIRPFNFFQKKKMDLYASPRVKDALKREFAYVFNQDNYPGIPQVELHTISNKPFVAGGLNFLPIEALHYKLPVFGYRIGDFTYLTDAKTLSVKEKKKISGSKVIILNALRKKSHISHFTLEEAVELLTELRPKKAYLTHISHQLGKHEEVERELPEFIRLAYDGLKFTV